MNRCIKMQCLILHLKLYNSIFKSFNSNNFLEFFSSCELFWKFILQTSSSRLRHTLLRVHSIDTNLIVWNKYSKPSLLLFIERTFFSFQKSSKWTKRRFERTNFRTYKILRNFKLLKYFNQHDQYNEEYI